MAKACNRQDFLLRQVADLSSQRRDLERVEAVSRNPRRVAGARCDLRFVTQQLAWVQFELGGMPSKRVRVDRDDADVDEVA